MSKVLFANKMQQEVLCSNDRITVITAEPGSGTTTALILKAINSCLQKNINAAFFVPTFHTANAPGGVADMIECMVGDIARFSRKSLIFTFTNGSKIKLIPTDTPIERSFGLSIDLMLFDLNINPAFIEHHLYRAYEAVVVSKISEIEKLDSWSRNLHLLELDGKGKAVSFVEGVKHIKGCLSDNHLFNGDSERYKKLTMQYLAESYKLDFN